MADLGRDPFPLRGRVALVTGVSRVAGIGYATARRLHAYGADLLLHHHSPHDADQPWGAQPLAEVLDGVRAAGQGRVEEISGDLVVPDAPARIVDAAIERFGRLDILVCNHARSGGDGTLREMTAAKLDEHYAVNTRSTLLLTQRFAHHFQAGHGGRVVFLTSGQQLGPMRGEVAYAAAKGALAAITATVSDELAEAGITVNAVNPGPVDTGWATPDLAEFVAKSSPAGRWGHPDDPARLIAWLATDEAEWITGQVLNSEGGFRRG
ncbi:MULTISPECIES: SDR family oxidoreductase [unclassified Crossiella]|uniref:SDR family oxidoreductase n=1 Tax=unclassified Crossiella TaxID=2620835 RepID=UPI001FFE3699|nr:MULTISPECIES: SDR family oxidoreductase [unclassified Crossiella]MCK2238727.1 SDR family oxidoreductase [Crossiella sp. S99.2]MCK2251703.1 SDR family oxidoreductase [Crossiella sp. S99.1]